MRCAAAAELANNEVAEDPELEEEEEEEEEDDDDSLPIDDISSPDDEW